LNQNAGAKGAVIRGVNRANIVSVQMIENAFLYVDAVSENVFDGSTIVEANSVAERKPFP